MKTPADYNSDQHIEVTQLSENLFRLKYNFGWSANVLALIGNDGILLVDSGYSAVKNFLKLKLNEIAKLPINCIINTHAHGDHMGGNSLLSSKGCLILHMNAVERIYQHQKVIAIKDEYSFTFNDENINVRAFPYGHSNTDVVVHLQNNNVIHTGDLYLAEAFPIIGSAKDTKAQTLLRHLIEIRNTYPQNTSIVSGHGRDTNMQDLDNYIDMIKETMRIVIREIDAGKSLHNIISENPLRKFEKWSGKIEFITTASWIDNIYKSYVAKP